MVSNHIILFFILFKFVAMFIGVCGNISVIILTRTAKFWSKEKTETSYLVGNLALADLLMCLTLYPAWIVELSLTILDIDSDQVLFCKFNRSLTFSLLFASVASLLAITFDRYIYIVKPLKYPLIVTRRRVFAVISAIWLTACLIFALWYVHVKTSGTGLRSVCFVLDSIFYSLVTFSTYIPLFVIIILNLLIVLVSRKQRLKISPEATSPASNNTNVDHQQRKNRMRFALRFFIGLKAAKTFSIVLAVLLLGVLTPTLISTMLQHFGNKAIIRGWLAVFHYEFYGINSVVNAFIYGLRHMKYRKGFGKIWQKVTSCFKFNN